jgi:dihydrofolate reductase
VGKLKLDLSISLDGLAAGPNQSIDNPLGEGGEQLHEWGIHLEAFKRMHGEEGGGVNANSRFLDQMFENVGAIIMGRNMFGGGPGDWGDESWKGWWGDEPPFHLPVFVLTHHRREPLPLGDTTFHFVTEGIQVALERARQAAGDKDILCGGAQTGQQYLAAGLLDEIRLHIVPVFLGGGERLFDNLGSRSIHLEQIEAVEGPGVTHIRYRVSY